MSTTPAYPNLAWPGLTWPGLAEVIPDGDRVVYTPPPRTLDELLAGSHHKLVAATVLSGPAAGELLPIVAAPLVLTHDATRVGNLSGTLSVAATDVWSEQGITAALDPRAGVEIGLAEGVRDDLGVEHWWQVGIVRPTVHSIVTTAQAVTVEVSVVDRGGVIAHAGAPRTMTIPAGTGILAGVQAALGEVAPWLPVEFPLDDDWPAENDITLAERAGDDLWERCLTVVRDMGRRLVVDPTGTAIAPERAAATAQEPAPVAVTEQALEVDWRRVVHRVVARSTEARPEDADSDWQPRFEDVAVEDTDAIAALSPLQPVRTEKYSGDESVLTAPGMARAAAAAELADWQDLVRSGSCKTVPHPMVRPGAVLDIDGDRYRITQMALDLAGGPVDVTMGAAARTLAVALAERLGYGAAGRESFEIVTAVTPQLLARPVGGDAAPRIVDRTDAMAGVAVGDVIRVMSDGPGRRVATAIVGSKTIGEKFSGQTLGRVGGKDLTVDGNVDLRVRTKSGSNYSSYASFSGGDVTVDVPAPPPPPDLSQYAKRTNIWRMNGYGLAPQWPSVPSTWSSSWGANLLAQLNGVISNLNNNRQVYWFSE